jgi:hypothetical protein
MNGQMVRGKILRWASLAASILIVTQVFFLQQLIVAFLIFAALFASLAATALILFALGHDWRIALDRAAMYISAFGRAISQGPAPLNNAVVARVSAPVAEHRAAKYE